MMNSNYILITSGFIIPENKYFSVLPEEKVLSTSIFNSKVMTAKDSNIEELVKTNQLYYSAEASEAYLHYTGTKSFEDYMRMVDISIEVFGKIDLAHFFSIQANNTNISPLSFRFCLELVSGDLLVNYLLYNSAINSARFSSNPAITNERINTNTRALKEASSSSYNTWEKLITHLTKNPDAFVTFYKYILTDSYQ